ncbi:MAG: hypothetical protein M0R46_09275 [Candidatus Muirbacterium halophilum]|nr:hypothetical protein [Candidatus Muirbacterium halophilum]MCK9476098.1 hypothetical protein [Candidatus Muirbacterium halophilum]
MLRTIINIECEEENISNFIHFSYLNYIFAKSHDGDFVIPYLDKNCEIYQILNKTIISDDKILKEIPQDILDRHRDYLIEKGKAFKENNDIYILSSKENGFNDYYDKNSMIFMEKETKIYIYQNNKYTFEFLNVLSEHFNYVTHKIRSKKQIEHTLKEVNFFREFNWITPGYAHIEPIKIKADKDEIVKFYKNLDSLSKIYDYIIDVSIKDECKDKYKKDNLCIENCFVLKDLKNKDMSLNI